jgi:Coenzyme PQQ synthesis protein D (PqqD)
LPRSDIGVIDPPDKPSRILGVVSSEILDETVLYCPGASQAIALNASARAIWELCDGTRTIDEMCIELSAIAGLSPDRLRDDVSGAVARLYELGLIHRGPA